MTKISTNLPYSDCEAGKSEAIWRNLWILSINFWQKNEASH